MAKYVSGRQKNIKVGISSYSENLTSLEVIGAAVFSGESGAELVRISQIGTGPAFIVEDSANPDTTPFAITTDGRVAIGLGPSGISTFYKLEVDGGGNGGDVRFVSGGQGDLIFSHSNLVSNIRAAGTVQLGLGANGGDAIRINLNNNVGLGSTNSTSKLYVVGDAYITGILTANRIFSAVYGEFTGGVSGTTIVGTSLSISGISTLGITTISQLYVSGITTLAANGGITTTGGDLYVGGDLYIADDLVFDEFTARNGNITGIATIATLRSTTANITTGNIVTGVVTTLSGTNLNYSGVGTITTLNSTTTNITTGNIVTGVVTTLSGTNLNYSGVGTVGRIVSTATSFGQLQVTGISTFTNGPVFVGSGTTTGTASQRLQVTGGAYVSGSIGVGTTNPRETLDVIGTVGVQASGSANRFYIQHNTTLNSLDFVFV